MLVRWVTGRGTDAELERGELVATRVRSFVERWEQADVPAMERSIAEQLELRLE